MIENGGLRWTSLDKLNFARHVQRKKCPYSGFLWSVFSRIQYEWGKIRTSKALNTDIFHAVMLAYSW